MFLHQAKKKILSENCTLNTSKKSNPITPFFSLNNEKGNISINNFDKITYTTQSIFLTFLKNNKRRKYKETKNLRKLKSINFVKYFEFFFFIIIKYKNLNGQRITLFTKREILHYYFIIYYTDIKKKVN